MAPTSSSKIKTKKSLDSYGAPSQHSQPSRKGKKAWRKNVDLTDLEKGLESIREDERVLGTALHKQPDSQLFTVDLTGDATIRRTVQKKPLKSTMILAARSAIPSVSSRSKAPSFALPKKAAPGAKRLSNEEKQRLLKIARRKHKGPFNSYVDPTQFGAGSAIMTPSEAVKESGKYDIWDEDHSDEEFVKDLQAKSSTLDEEDVREYLIPLVKKLRVKPPKSDEALSSIEVKAVQDPHQGTSYNPYVDAHQDLLKAAHEVEVVKEAEHQKQEAIRETMRAAGQAPRIEDDSGALGMQIDIPNSDQEDEAEDAEPQSTKVVTVRKQVTKTKQQRAKAARVREEKRLAAEKVAKKRFASSFSALKSIKRSVNAQLSASEKAAIERKLARRNRFKEGLTGKRAGKYKVPKATIDVQLGDELADSLRGLKPEGNLLRDRMLSLQQRALVEPRVPAVPRRNTARVKEYEKHEWKRFQ
ncbi:hypothetical protein FRC03_002639 [Tulasnella sp. 419]|nr:hypothetical protein FRC02_000329 [Tulasnella sp. 418]KAG8943163.1 hypothetical protein FRC03_002639 [Tulasnella sp. 419]